MDSFSDDEESRFFDAMEHIVQEPDLVSNLDSPKNGEYDLWISVPQSVRERRREFSKRMGLVSGDSVETDDFDNGRVFDIDRVLESNGSVLRTSDIKEDFSSRGSSLLSWYTDYSDISEGVCLNECRDVNETSSNCGVCENSCLSVERFEQRGIECSCDTLRTMDRLMERWLTKWRSFTCMISRIEEDDNDVGLDSFNSKKIRRVRVRHYRKKLKELSALFTDQDIEAHDGSILTMKFSPDGLYLASGGEDNIVRIWQVVEDERLEKVDVPGADPSCVYFSVNHLSELVPLVVEKDKVKKLQGLREQPDSACIIFPRKVFRLVEEPLNVFRGHNGEILDISWSKTNCLLSSSVDKTVRLWKVGVDQCLKIFHHTDYVTCVQFNPLNDDNFISGSIDGKVRTWTINGCQVTDWNETRDIVTAVSYRPDGQGGIIGFFTGTCQFFNISDNHLQLENQICLASKKKSPCKRITGFQFLPQDSTKVLVTCADQQVRIIDRSSVIEKYKGHRNAVSQISASLTSDGKHIVAASDDSNIYIWNYNSDREPSFSRPKVANSFECFSADASIAITWSGLNSSTLNNTSFNPLPFSSSTCFSLSQDFPSDSRVSATWPEEKLRMLSSKAVTSAMGKSHYKLFKTSCQSSSNSHAWGLVIVTAGWDGRIRSFHNYGLPVTI